jgi:CRISPR-associated protein Csm5
MSEPLLVQHRLRIETLSGLHIGTGEELKAKDYAMQGQEIFVVNPEKVLALARNSLVLENAFLAFCENGRQSLMDFLQQEGIPVDQIAAYSVKATARAVRRIPVFIKTAEGKPYLPGSSLKGAVRSALFRSRVMADNAVRGAAAKAVRDDLNEIHQQQNPSLSRWRKKIGTDAERRSFFGSDEHHDLMRALQIGDSAPRQPGELRIAEVHVLSIGANDELRPAQDTRGREMLPLTPEVLPRGVEVACPLTVNLYLLRATPPVTQLDFGQRVAVVQGWLAECNRTARNLIEQEIDFFTRHPLNGRRQVAEWYKALRGQLDAIEKAVNQCLLRMSWGSGWDAKTVTDQFDAGHFDEIRRTLRLKVGQPRGSSTPLPKQDSPKSRKIAFENGQPQEPLGWVKVTVEEATN